MYAGFDMGASALVALIIGGCTLLLLYILKQVRSEFGEDKPQECKRAVPRTLRKKELSVRNKKKGESRWGSRDKQHFTHPWLLTSLKSHTGQVIDMNFSSNEKYLASCGDDRTVFLWDTKDLSQKDHRCLRINIDFDYATFVRWSPDTKAFIIQKYNENTIEVYKIEKKKDSWIGTVSKATTFPKGHQEDVIGLDIACNGKFIMSCSNKTDLIVWDLKGQELARVDTYLMTTNCAKVSPCGRFIVASGFAPDVKVWEVLFSKTGEFQEVKRVFDLTGHSSGVDDVAFDGDSSHMATVSKDRTWKLYNTNVEYKKGEDPKLLITGKYEPSSYPSHIALSPNAEVVAVTSSDTIYFYSTFTGNLDFTIENVFEGNITSVMFDCLGKYLLVSGDRFIRIFHNVTGYRCAIEGAKEKLKQKQTSATKERLEKLISDSEKFLQQF